MKLEFEPIKGQSFEIGRTINPFECNCISCDFMNCPKHNYAVKMKRKYPGISRYLDDNSTKIVGMNSPKRWMRSFRDKYPLKMDCDLINDMFDYVDFKFPKGTYWDTDGDEIRLVKFGKSGREITLGYITVSTSGVYDCGDLTVQQKNLAESISKCLTEIKSYVFEKDIEKDNSNGGWVIGWLSPGGEHFPCSSTEHCTLASMLGGEGHLESTGWVKVAMSDEYFCNSWLTDYQKVWLYENGLLDEQ